MTYDNNITPTTSNNSGLAARNSSLTAGSHLRPIASLSDAEVKKLTALEGALTGETGEKVALVAYRL